MTEESEVERRFLEEITKMTEGDMLIIRIADQSRENYSMALYHDRLDKFAGFMNLMGPKVSAMLVSLLMRPGSSMFWMMLEHTYFNPTGPEEKLYLAAWVRWQDQIWVIGVVPAQLSWTFEEAAKRTNMRIADGIPTIFDQDGIHQFPIPWAKTLENANADGPNFKATADGIEMLAEGIISPQEFTRRVRNAERGMYYDEFRQIKEFYREHGLERPGYE